MRRRRRSPIAALALAALAAGARAGTLATGDPAPWPQVKETIGLPSFTAKDAEGRVVLYEVFRTWSAECKPLVGRLNGLWEKDRDRGLLVLAVTNEDRPLVERFVKDTGCRHPVVIEGGDSVDAFGTENFPTLILIDTEGRVAWSGRPGSLEDAEIEKLLRFAHPLPPLPKKLAPVLRSLEKGDCAGARKALEGMLAGTGLDEPERKAATAAVKWIDDRGAAMLASAAEDEKRGEAWAAAVTLRRAAESFKGLETSTKAEAALKALDGDKDKKREVEAGDAWEKAREKVRTMKLDLGAALCREFAKRYEGTKAAEKAKAMADRLEGLAKGR